MTTRRSPAHRDFQKYNIPRTVITLPGLVPGGIVVLDPRQFAKEMQEHKEQESRNPTREERQRAIADMRAYFRRIFGDEWHRRATSLPRQ